MASSILFCTGPMAILGAIQDGLIGDFQLLAIKSVMDGFAAFAMASTLGIGVLFSGPMVFIYQGFFSVLAVQLQGIMTPAYGSRVNSYWGSLADRIGYQQPAGDQTHQSRQFPPQPGDQPFDRISIVVILVPGLSIPPNLFLKIVFCTVKLDKFRPVW